MQLADPIAGNPLELRVPALPKSVTEVRHSVGDYAQRAGSDRDAVELAVTEAVTNSVIHGYPRGESGEIVVRASVERSRLVVEVCDNGSGMRANPDSPGLGLGLPLIGKLSEQFTIATGPSGGALVSMRFTREELRPER